MTQKAGATTPRDSQQQEASTTLQGEKNVYDEYRLTPQQRDVVQHVCEHDDTVTAVDASAGTGKTFTLVRGVLTLILNAWERWKESGDESDRVDIDQFVLITFTNKAADELRRKIQKALKDRLDNAPDEEKELWDRQLERASGAFVGTIHSFCKGQILRPFGYDQGVSREAGATFSAKLLDDAIRDVMEAYAGGDLPEMIRDALNDADRIREVIENGAGEDLFAVPNRLAQHEFQARMRKAVNLIHNRGYSTEDALQWTVERQDTTDPHFPLRQLFAALVRVADDVYRQKKAEERVVDQYDMLDRAVQVLEGDEQDPTPSRVAERIATRYRYLLIDEFQDTDALQKRIVDAFVDVLDGILVVGDWKQSIYRFRGAEPELLETISEEHMTANQEETDDGRRVSRPFPLRVSSRPSEPLRIAINTLLESVGTRFERLNAQLEPWVDPWEPHDDIPEIIVRGAGTYDQAARIQAAATSIQNLLGREWENSKGKRRQVEPGDVVVLCRSNEDVDTYARGLTQRGLEARPDNGQSLYRSPEVVSVYRMLRLILNEGDASTLVAALPTPYLKDVDLRERERDAIQYGIPSDNYLIDKFATDHPDLLTPSSANDGEKGTIDRLRKNVRKRTASQMLDQLYDEFGIFTYYQRRDNTAAIQNLQRLREIARTLASDDQALTLRAFSDYLRRAIDVDQEETRVEADDAAEVAGVPYVRVMTIHRAKGLEFPFVVIPEIQRDLVQDWATPEMIFTTEHGLDISVYGERDGVPDTRSHSFRNILDAERTRDIEEEMRVFYVGVTRAQHTVMLIGDGNAQPNYVNDDAFEGAYPGVDEYAWQDEVLRARQSLETLSNSADNHVRVDFRFDG